MDLLVARIEAGWRRPAPFRLWQHKGTPPAAEPQRVKRGFALPPLDSPLPAQTPPPDNPPAARFAWLRGELRAGLLITFLVCGLAFSLLPALDARFVSDDFFLLVSDADLPWLQSSDQLHRPFRNALHKVFSASGAVQNPAFPRGILFGFYLLTLYFLYALCRELGQSRLAALAALLCFAFLPRHHQELYWFAAGQDVVSGCAIAAAGWLYLRAKHSASSLALAGATIAYFIGMGFKETTVVLLGLLVLLDLYTNTLPLREWFSGAARRLLPFLAVSLLFAAYFALDQGVDALKGEHTGGFYGFRGIGNSFLGFLRLLFRLLLPLSSSIDGLSALSRSDALALVLVSTGIAWLSWRGNLVRLTLFAFAWIAISLSVVSAFSIFNADRYLFVAYFAPLLWIAAVTDTFLVRPMASGRRGMASVLGWVALLAFVAVSLVQLSGYRQSWRRAGDIAQAVAVESAQLCSGASRVDLAFIPHSLAPQVFVINNGLWEILSLQSMRVADPESVLLYDTGEAALGPLRQSLQSCPSAPISGARCLAIWQDNRLRRLDPACALPLMEADRKARPFAWLALDPRQRR